MIRQPARAARAVLIPVLIAATPSRAVDFGAPVVIAGEAIGAISVWTERGKQVDAGESSFDVADALAVGDVDGGGADEMVIEGDVTGQVEICRLGGSTSPARRLASPCGIADEIAVGDVLGDGRAETLVVDDVSEDVTIYDNQGTELARFGVNSTALDGFALVHVARRDSASSRTRGRSRPRGRGGTGSVPPPRSGRPSLGVSSCHA